MASTVSFPVTTARLTLRLHESSDATPLFEIYSRPDVAVYLLEDPWSEEDAAAKVAKRIEQSGLDVPAHALMVAIEHAGTVIGDVQLWYTEAEHKVAEIGWVLSPDFGGQGFAAEAVTAVLDLAFDTYGCRRVLAQMDGRNKASAKLAERVGMTREAHFRQDWFSKGEWTDTLVYAMLATDRG